MQSPLDGTATKWIAFAPRWDGDLISNLAFYQPQPDYNDIYYKRLALLAEKYTADGANARYFRADKRMLYCGASSGEAAFQTAERYAKRVIEKNIKLSFAPDADPADVKNASDKLTPRVLELCLQKFRGHISPEDFADAVEEETRGTLDPAILKLTVQRLADALDPAIMAADVFEENYGNNDIAVKAAREQLKAFIIGPGDREGHLRAINMIHSMAQGAKFEDIIFEIHMWGPICLHEVNAGIYFHDHAWSRHAAMEKGIALAIQYGVQQPLQIRQFESCDITDIKGRDVSVVDQAWEEARHIVDVVERGFRTEVAAALLLTRFMYDDYYREGMDDKLFLDHAHDTVKAHYNDAGEVAKMDMLKSIMLPYMAQHCDWSTLQAALDNDAGLRRYWDEKVTPMLGKTPDFKQALAQFPELAAKMGDDYEPPAETVRATEEIVFGYLPRGGYESHWKLAKYVKHRKDPPLTITDFGTQAEAGSPWQGVHENPFCQELAPRRFHDNLFEQLGVTRSRTDKPNQNHMTPDQLWALTFVNACRDGAPPHDKGRTLFYLDDPSGGIHAGAYLDKHQGDSADHPAEAKAAFNPLVKGSKTFKESVNTETAYHLLARIREIAVGAAMKVWRGGKNRWGNVLSISDVAHSAAGMEGKRKGLNVDMHEMFAAKGPIRISGMAKEAAARRLIGLVAEGVAIPAGTLTDLQYRCIGEAVEVAVGKVPRTYEGGAYRMEFFLDHDWWKPPPLRGDSLQKLDLGDVILHSYAQLRPYLKMKNPPALRDRVVTMMRLFDTYERLIDPARCNVERCENPLSGEDSQSSVIDWRKVDNGFKGFKVYDPRFPAFYEAYLDSAGQEPASLIDNDDYRNFVADPDVRAFLNDELDWAAYLFDDDGQVDPVKKAKLVKMAWFEARAMAIQVAPGTQYEPPVYAPVPGLLTVKGIHALEDRADLHELPDEYSAAHEWWHNMSEQEKQNVFEQGTVHIQGPGVSVR